LRGINGATQHQPAFYRVMNSIAYTIYNINRNHHDIGRNARVHCSNFNMRTALHPRNAKLVCAIWEESGKSSPNLTMIPCPKIPQLYPFLAYDKDKSLVGFYEAYFS